MTQDAAPGDWRAHAVERGLDLVYLFAPVHDGSGALVDLRVVDANVAGRDALAVAALDVPGALLSAILLPGDFRTTLAMYRDVMTSGHALANTMEIVNPVTGVATLLIEQVIVPSAGDMVVVTARNRVEDLERATELAERRAFLQAIIDADPNIIFVKNPDGQYVLFNRALGEFTGVDPDDAIGRADHDLGLSDEAAEPLRVLDREVIDDRRTVTGVHTVGNAHDVPRRLRYVKTPVVMPDGSVNVLGVATDITDLIEAELRLRASEARFRAALHGSAVPTAVTDGRTGEIIEVNGAYEDFTGYPASQLMSIRPADLIRLLTHPDDIDREHVLYEAMRRGDLDTYTLERRFVTRRGDTRWGIATVSCTRTDDGRIDQVVVQVLDITDRLEAEARLRESDALVRALVRHSTDVVTVRVNDAVTYVSPAIEHVLGYRPEQYPARGMGEIVHPDDLGTWNEHERFAIEHPGVVHTVEVRVCDATGRWVWVESTIFNLLDDPDVGGIVDHFRDVTDQHVAEEELARRALHDALTGLPNRMLLLDRVHQALERSRRQGLTCVAFCDIDRFKVVNDSLGHAVGDELIKAVAERMQRIVRPSDTVARLGGDEFVICASDLEHDDEAVDLVERVLQRMREPFHVGGREVRVTASIGLAVAGADATPEALLRDADSAMYVAKGNGRDRFEAFNADVRARVIWRMEVEHDLHHALGNDELVLHYQPIVDLGSGRVVAAEALLRWAHPRRGVLPPGDFVAIAEETGLIVPIGEWALAAAARQLRTWRDTGVDEIATLWVNLSTRQFERPDFATVAEHIVRDHDLEPKSIGLEITESVLLSERVDAGRVLQDLSDTGFRIAIDDFGTGYSSLSYLQRLPVDVLKVDRSFVAGVTDTEGDRSIVSAVIGLAHMLGIAASAEGVEHPDQLAVLRELGCDTACGFHMARPGPAGPVEALLRTRPRW